MRVDDKIEESQRVAVFDFDGTITEKDSLKDFLIYMFGFSGFFNGMILLSPILILYKLGIVKNYKAKEMLIKYFFKGMDFEDFNKKSTRYSLNNLRFFLNETAKERIRWHKAQGHKMIVVSASIINWIEPWASREGFEAVLSTELEVEDGKLTGRFATKNCYGIEKVNRLKEYLDSNKSYYLYAYGDTKGDRELLEFANESYYDFKRILK
jgi:HAD superfamily hydrolase (TIGR01490 family)